METIPGVWIESRTHWAGRSRIILAAISVSFSHLKYNKKIRHCRVNVLIAWLDWWLYWPVTVKKNYNWIFIFILFYYYFLTGIIMSIWPNLVRPGQNIDNIIAKECLLTPRVYNSQRVSFDHDNAIFTIIFFPHLHDVPFTNFTVLVIIGYIYGKYPFFFLSIACI